MQSHHFPIGSALLYREVNNQWTIGQILSIQAGQLVVQQKGKDDISMFLPSSEHIGPVDAYLDGLCVVIKNGKLLVYTCKFIINHFVIPLII